MKTKINCIIVDDEPLSKDILKDYVENCPELNLLATYPNALEARDAIIKGEIDLVLLDINMPKLSGINMMKSLPNPPLVIFVTAYPEYAVEGFDLDAIDYLLKPVSFERFSKAINRVTEKLQNDHPAETSGDHIMVKADKKIFRIDLTDIFYLEAQGDYVKIYTDTRTLMVYGTLTGFAEKLPTDRFCRIHKSYLVSISRIEYIEGNSLKIRNNSLPISSTYKDQLTNLLKI